MNQLSIKELSATSSRRERRSSFAWQPLVIGGLAFLLLVHPTILKPSNYRWLMTGDPAMNQLGWIYFRDAPLLQQPFGANPGYGMEVSNCTVYTDSVSLLAFPLKPFSPWLPQKFQYFGFWILICYVLQAFFSWRLLSMLISDVWAQCIGTCFFLIAPPFLCRIEGHLSLGAHWLILASLSFYFAHRFRLWPWILLLVAASLTTPILLTMSFMIFAAALAKHWLEKEINPYQIAKNLALTLLLLGLAMWQAGYFSVSTPGAGGFGIMRTSLLGFIDPGETTWSCLLPNLPQAPGNYEGYSFLGTGVILLVIAAAFLSIKKGVNLDQWRRLAPLLCVATICFLFALSNNIGIGPYVIFHYDIPSWIERLISPYRSSGRFVWVPYYVIIAGALAIAARKLGRTTYLTLLGAALLIQVADSWPALRGIAPYAYDKPVYHSSVRSQFWEVAAGHYRQIAFVLPKDADTPDRYDLYYYAANHNMTLNSAHWARCDEPKLERCRAAMTDVVKRGDLDKHTLYIFDSLAVWMSTALRMQDTDWAGVVDGRHVIAPNWYDKPTRYNFSRLISGLPGCNIGAKLGFQEGSQNLSLLGLGWSRAEPWGVWSDGEKASLILLLPPNPSNDVLLGFDGMGFVSKKNPVQNIEAVVNSTTEANFSYSLESPSGIRQIRIPREVVAAQSGLVDIEFEFKNCDSPFRLGLNGDQRQLAFGLASLTINPNWYDKPMPHNFAQIVSGMPHFDIGAKLGFQEGSQNLSLLGLGWSHAEPWGVWSDGEKASLILLLPPNPSNDVLLGFDGIGFVSKKNPVQNIEATVNSTIKANFTYSLESPNGIRQIRIPREVVAARSGVVDIEFEFKNVNSPFRLGLSGDQRELAFGLKSIVINP